MEMPRCHRCGNPVSPEDINLRTMQASCRTCGYIGSALVRAGGRPAPADTGMPPRPVAAETERPPTRDYFGEEFGLRSISSRLALMALAGFLAFLWFPELGNLALASLSAFAFFALSFLFLRLRGG